MRKKLIYIGGYGWSGSTLLTRLLMVLPKVQSLGEFHYILNDLSANDKCSCGATASTCTFWSKYYHHYKRENISEARLLTLLYQDHPEITFIDASKTTYPHHNRPLELAKDFDVFFIHLVRDGKSVLASNLKRHKFLKMVKTITTAIQWFLANQSGDRFKKKGVGKYFLLRYEDMVLYPKALLEELSEMMGMPFDENKNDLEALPLGHQLSGNAIRFQAPLKVEIKESAAPPLGYKYKLFKFLNSGKLKAYGYL